MNDIKLPVDVIDEVKFRINHYPYICIALLGCDVQKRNLYF